MHTNWNINVSFVIHVNFDHAWAEHYSVTLTQKLFCVQCGWFYHGWSHIVLLCMKILDNTHLTKIIYTIPPTFGYYSAV